MRTVFRVRNTRPSIVGWMTRQRRYTLLSSSGGSVAVVWGWSPYAPEANHRTISQTRRKP